MTTLLHRDAAPTAAHTGTRPDTPRVVPPAWLFTRLDREWEQLVRCPRRAHRARSWHVSLADAHSLDEVLRRAGFGVGAGPDGDAVLAELVAAARDDALAARVVLQRVLPGLRAIDRRRGPRSRPSTAGSPPNDRDDLLATAWTVIRTYPIDHRPQHVAAGLLAEIEYRTFRAPHRRTARFVPTAPSRLDRPSLDPEPSVEAADIVRRLFAQAAARGIDPAALELVRRLAAGTASDDLAAELGVSARTIRNRRDAAVRALRRLPAARS